MRSLLVVALSLAACGQDDAPDGGLLDAQSDAQLDGQSETGQSDSGVDAGDSGRDAGERVDAGDPLALPDLLSELGLRDEAGELTPGAQPYAVAYPLWSDGSDKQRFLRLRAGTRIDTSNPNAWVFPVGTEVFKEFWVEGALIETRVFAKRAETAEGWRFVSYVWREDGSDAEARPEGVRDAGGTQHDVPSVEGCFDCHRGQVDRMLGLSLFQLDSVDDFIARGWLDPGSARLPPPGEGIVPDALGYLNANCGHCHSDVHPLASFRAMRLNLRRGDAVMDAGFFRTAIGLEAQHVIGGTRTIVVPGDPDASQLFVRMGLRTLEGMPTRGTEVVDVSGRAMVRELIEGL